MKTIAHFICAISMAYSLAAHSQSDYSGITYEVEITRDNGDVSSGVCITFHESGRFTKSDETLTMLWAPEAHYPDRFMAVTAPGERTVVPYHLGVHGTLQPDETLTGRGIEASGSTFVFHGRSKDDCGIDRSDRSAGDPTQRPTDSTRWRLDRVTSERLAAQDRCWSPPGPHVPCDPISKLVGRSFLLTLGTSDNRVLEYCWTFGKDRSIKTLNGGEMRWSPAGIARESAPFQSVGAGDNGRGMAYHGALIGDELLQVAGIEARDGKSVVAYGYGQTVSTCE